jgi:hypothetical protein
MIVIPDFEFDQTFTPNSIIVPGRSHACVGGPVSEHLPMVAGYLAAVIASDQFIRAPMSHRGAALTRRPVIQRS